MRYIIYVYSDDSCDVCDKDWNIIMSFDNTDDAEEFLDKYMYDTDDYTFCYD